MHLWVYRGLTTCLADMMVQMKIPAETKAIDKYLLFVYLQEKMVKIWKINAIRYKTEIKPPIKESTSIPKSEVVFYLFFNMTMPIIMLAIRDPWK